jgi:hypothetical protein
MADESRSWLERVLGTAGLALGITLVVFAVSGWKVPTGGGSLGSDLYLSSGPTGELQVVPSGPFLRAREMRPGSPAAVGTITVRNQTGSTVSISVLALPDRPDLDPLLKVRITSGSQTVFRGTLGDLAAGTEGLFELAPSHGARLRFRAWFPATVVRGYQGRIVSVPIQFQADAL